MALLGLVAVLLGACGRSRECPNKPVLPLSGTGYTDCISMWGEAIPDDARDTGWRYCDPIPPYLVLEDAVYTVDGDRFVIEYFDPAQGRVTVTYRILHE